MPVQTYHSNGQLILKPELNKIATHDDIRQALQDLAKDGLIVDTGRKKWSDSSGQYEILWVLSPTGRDKPTKLINSLSSSNTLANTPTNRRNSTN